MEEKGVIIVNGRKPGCIHCGSKFGYVKIKQQEFQCRKCGKITKVEYEKEDN